MPSATLPHNVPVLEQCNIVFGSSPHFTQCSIFNAYTDPSGQLFAMWIIATSQPGATSHLNPECLAASCSNQEANLW